MSSNPNIIAQAADGFHSTLLFYLDLNQQVMTLAEADGEAEPGAKRKDFLFLNIGALANGANMSLLTMFPPGRGQGSRHTSSIKCDVLKKRKIERLTSRTLGISSHVSHDRLHQLFIHVWWRNAPDTQTGKTRAQSAVKEATRYIGWINLHKTFDWSLLCMSVCCLLPVTSAGTISTTGERQNEAWADTNPVIAMCPVSLIKIIDSIF